MVPARWRGRLAGHFRFDDRLIADEAAGAYAATGCAFDGLIGVGADVGHEGKEFEADAVRLYPAATGIMVDAKTAGTDSDVGAGRADKRRRRAAAGDQSQEKRERFMRHGRFMRERG